MHVLLMFLRVELFLMLLAVFAVDAAAADAAVVGVVAVAACCCCLLAFRRMFGVCSTVRYY